MYQFFEFNDIWLFFKKFPKKLYDLTFVNFFVIFKFFSVVDYS